MKQLKTSSKLLAGFTILIAVIGLQACGETGPGRLLEPDALVSKLSGMFHSGALAGCRVLVTLLHEMIREDKKIGLASLCLGGGEAVALVVKR